MKKRPSQVFVFWHHVSGLPHLQELAFSRLLQGNSAKFAPLGVSPRRLRSLVHCGDLPD